MISQTDKTRSRSFEVPGFLPASVQSVIRSLPGLRHSIPQVLKWIWTQQRHWLLPLIPFSFLVYRPLHLTWATWFSRDSLLIFQPFVPLLAFYLAWERRHQIASSYRQFCSIWPAESKKRRGQVWLLLLGCLLTIIASLAIVPSLSVFALVISFIGVVYYVYGWYVITLLAVPLLFLFLMTPPGNLLGRIVAPFEMGNSIALGGALRTIFPAIKTLGNMVFLPNVRMVITPELGGVAVVLASLVLTLWLCLRYRVRYFNYPVVLLLGLVIALIVNFVRLCLLSLILNSNPVFGGNLIKLPSWILVAIVFLFLRPLVQLFRPRTLSSIGEGDDVEQ